MIIKTHHLPLREGEADDKAKSFERSRIRSSQNSSAVQGKRTGRVPSLPTFAFLNKDNDDAG